MKPCIAEWLPYNQVTQVGIEETVHSHDGTAFKRVSDRVPFPLLPDMVSFVISFIFLIPVVDCSAVPRLRGAADSVAGAMGSLRWVC